MDRTENGEVEDLTIADDATSTDQEQLTAEEIELHLEECDERSRLCIEQLLVELAEAIESRQRALADFKNFQRRSVENEHRMNKIASAHVLRSILPVIDQMEMALQQDTEQVDSDRILEGVQIVRDEMDKVLTEQGVERINPDVGDEFDPNLHEAMLEQAADGVASGCIVEVLQPGFRLRDQVLRPAKVMVAP